MSSAFADASAWCVVLPHGARAAIDDRRTLGIKLVGRECIRVRETGVVE